MKKQKKQFRMPTAFTVLILLTIVVAIITQFIPAITPATAADVIMAPIDGFASALGVALFVLIGVICSLRAKKRRLREKRLKVSAGSVSGITTGAVGAVKASHGNHGSSHGKKDDAPKPKPKSNSKGGGRHMRQ